MTYLSLIIFDAIGPERFNGSGTHASLPSFIITGNAMHMSRHVALLVV